MDKLNVALTQENLELINKYENFYRSLENGDRAPTTDAQKHFVAVCNGKAEVNTSHELAWMRYKNQIQRDTELHIIHAQSTGSDITPKATPQQVKKQNTSPKNHGERERIMSLVRNSKQPLERLELIMTNAESIGLTEDDKEEVRKKMDEEKRKSRLSGSPANYIIVFSNTDGQ